MIKKLVVRIDRFIHGDQIRAMNLLTGWTVGCCFTYLLMVTYKIGSGSAKGADWASCVIALAGLVAVDLLYPYLHHTARSINEMKFIESLIMDHNKTPRRLVVALLGFTARKDITPEARKLAESILSDTREHIATLEAIDRALQQNGRTAS
jgi:hypothetical protein